MADLRRVVSISDLRGFETDMAVKDAEVVRLRAVVEETVEKLEVHAVMLSDHQLQAIVLRLREALK
jgi:hypothetical protein